MLVTIVTSSDVKGHQDNGDCHSDSKDKETDDEIVDTTAKSQVILK